MPRLMRNDPKRGGLCKYALIRLDKMSAQQIKNIRSADDRNEEIVNVLINHPELIEIGEPGAEEEFFCVKLKDQNTFSALHRYADNAFQQEDADLANDVRELANRSSHHNKWCKRPD